MPLFDISSGIKAQYRSGAQPQDAYKIMKKIVVDFAKRGYAVKWTIETPPSKLEAQLTDKDGTNLKAQISIVDEGTTTLCDILIAGTVFLGGLLGRLVSASTIQGRASEKIKEMLDENFAGQPAKRAPLAAAAPAPKPAVPTTLPPGHPGAKAAAPPDQPPAPAPAPVAPPPPVAAPAPAPAPIVAKAVEPPVEAKTAAEPGDVRGMILKAAAAAAAVGAPVVDTTLMQPVQVALVQALAKQRGKKLDRAAASQLLMRMGAGAQAQGELAATAAQAGGWLKPTAAAWALTVAVGEAALQGVVDAPPSDEALKDLFEATYERVLGEKVAAHDEGDPLGDKLTQVKEAYDADLISEAEMTSLRERVLAAL